MRVGFAPLTPLLARSCSRVLRRRGVPRQLWGELADASLFLGWGFQGAGRSPDQRKVLVQRGCRDSDQATTLTVLKHLLMPKEGEMRLWGRVITPWEAINLLHPCPPHRVDGSKT